MRVANKARNLPKLGPVCARIPQEIGTAHRLPTSQGGAQKAGAMMPDFETATIATRLAGAVMHAHSTILAAATAPPPAATTGGIAPTNLDPRWISPADIIGIYDQIFVELRKRA